MLTLADNETVESNCREIFYRRLTFMYVIFYFAFWNMAIWGLDTHKPPTSCMAETVFRQLADHLQPFQSVVSGV